MDPASAMTLPASADSSYGSSVTITSQKRRGVTPAGLTHLGDARRPEFVPGLAPDWAAIPLTEALRSSSRSFATLVIGAARSIRLMVLGQHLGGAAVAFHAGRSEMAVSQRTSNASEDVEEAGR